MTKQASLFGSGVPLDSPLKGQPSKDLASITPGLARSHLISFIYFPAPHGVWGADEGCGTIAEAPRLGCCHPIQGGFDGCSLGLLLGLGLQAAYGLQQPCLLHPSASCCQAIQRFLCTVMTGCLTQNASGRTVRFCSN